jgi:hypothetical protein
MYLVILFFRPVYALPSRCIAKPPRLECCQALVYHIPGRIIANNPPYGTGIHTWVYRRRGGEQGVGPASAQAYKGYMVAGFGYGKDHADGLLKE